MILFIKYDSGNFVADINMSRGKRHVAVVSSQSKDIASASPPVLPSKKFFDRGVKQLQARRPQNLIDVHLALIGSA